MDNETLMHQMAVLAKESLARAVEYSTGLKAGDRRFNQSAYVEHVDGSTFYIKCAFLMDDPEDPTRLWLITEHFGEHVFDKEDLETYRTGPLDSQLTDLITRHM